MQDVMKGWLRAWSLIRGSKVSGKENRAVHVQQLDLVLTAFYRVRRQKLVLRLKRLEFRVVG